MFGIKKITTCTYDITQIMYHALSFTYSQTVKLV